MTRIGPALILASILTLAVGCASPASTPQSTVPAINATHTAEEQAETAGAKEAIMPDVVCHNLQTAQDEIQAAGVFYSRSEDASGKGRAQIMDRNWIVVSQTPAPGSPIGEGDAVLSVVKEGEPSSC